LALALGTLALAFAGIGCRREVAPHGDLSALVAGAKALEAPPGPRRIARPTIPGTSGEALLALGAQLASLAQSKELAERCAKTFEGEDPSAHKACALELAGTESAFAAILRTADAERAVAPAPLHPLAPTDTVSRLPRELLAFCSHARTRALGSMRSDTKDAGLGTCARALEVVRDFSLGGNLVAAMSVSSCIDTLAPACGRVLGGSARSAAQTFAQDLGNIEESLPGFSVIARGELFSVQLSLCGTFLAPNDRAELGPLGQATVAMAERNKPPAMEQGLHQHLCKTGIAAALVRDRAYQYPRGSTERERVLREGKEAIEGEKVASMDLGKYEERWEAGRTQLRELRARAQR
jgi:hypothetical protein